jgi:hypothetical protein
MSKSIKLIDFFLKEITAHFPPTQQKMSFERHATYKTFGDFKYHLNMPDEWILNELPGTGRECLNCVGDRDHGDCDGFAMWRGIILGYCANCAKNYEGKRCRGFVGVGLESDLFEYQSAFDTYLGHVDFENYGCLADNEMHTMENRKCDLEDIIQDYTGDIDDDREHYEREEDDREHYEREEAARDQELLYEELYKRYYDVISR